MSKRSCFIDVQPGETIAVTGDAVVEFVHKTGRVARLKITAADEVKIEKNASKEKSNRPAVEVLVS